MAARRLARAYGASGLPAPTRGRAHEHFGLVIVSCERADLRLRPDGVMIYAADEPRLHRLEPPAIPRAEVIDELYEAVVERRPPRHDGASGLATLETCLALLASSREGREIKLAGGDPVGGRRTETAGG
jgi:phthalate 4,5-cis-dihydrodiol dehydrogenase